MGGRDSLVLPERAALLSPFCSLCGEEEEAPGAAGPSSCPGVFSVAGAARCWQGLSARGPHTCPGQGDSLGWPRQAVDSHY